ncbi:hypothetical protein BO82DRAFT_36507 [Aspergillus uvarum CBS 121591]|uniref:C2H2-type domain-containing protein n=1 Tax=Aspergillus uvarum CBS 121591 TaxID=1448315 RepID=A0A319BS42_9EURO|nr:hypothetical protein BO82DRAFT_36507 [Aspergillus uvarum CBS 121591]PYH75344.1 hypothetical protein BO82DRAFT_36507 [Aspergillus uvarum CBS 121591]
MSSLQRQFNTQKAVLRQSTIKYLCPECLRGFPRPDTLYRHFQDVNDEAHKGLRSRKDDYNQFYSCYQKCLGASIPSKCLPKPPHCFELQYVIEHYGKDLDNGASTTSNHGIFTEFSHTSCLS